ncbi:MFS general substrate transporter [Aureobasidium namibiae CBS 147.97]|uniref:MFS general substrate transporter n=1 Tax=Aureobasidium namibiae CBS 147.97 TaxID=1043004 RepID=A0A074X0M0_9PEZI|nr:MFS general substrate transporter [Aureobasidium namibiae CBS 147.97]KEQ75582.1 MFS general substrate transporter [Aureobasidium namibiae CBS 147.97]
MIAANALNEGTTQPYEDPIAEDYQRQHHTDGDYVEKQTTSRSIRSESGVATNNLEKQTTRRSVRSGKAVSVNNVAAIPNGGTKAWLQVLGAFTLFFNSWGIINTFGAYQTYYQSGILSSSSPSDISWIGSVQAFLLMLVGALTGPIYDAGYFRTLLSIGSFLVVFGFMMLSLCKTYWQVILAQGICVGLGAGCLFVPSVAILSTYFSTRIATAMGLAAAGSSLGGVIYPIVFYRLEPRIGFPWATRVIGFIALATLIVANSVMRVRVLPAARRAVFDLKAFTELPYLLFVLGGFTTFMGLYAPFFYVESYGITYNITSESLGFYTLSIINSASVFGRIIPNLIADRTGPMNMIVPCCLISGVVALCLIPVRSVAGLVIVCLLYGFFSGALVSLPPTVFVHLTPNRSLIGTRMGQGFSIISIGLLLGTPICGWILDGSSFTYVWVFSGVLIIAGGCLMLLSRYFKAGAKLMQKV